MSDGWADNGWIVDPPVEKSRLRQAVEALPVGAIVKIGRRFPSGVQGSPYMRTSRGLRYVGPARDDWEGSTLDRETSVPDHDLEVIAVPVGYAEIDRLAALVSPDARPPSAAEWLRDDDGEIDRAIESALLSVAMDRGRGESVSDQAEVVRVLRALRRALPDEIEGVDLVGEAREGEG